MYGFFPISFPRIPQEGGGAILSNPSSGGFPGTSLFFLKHASQRGIPRPTPSTPTEHQKKKRNILKSLDRSNSLTPILPSREFAHPPRSFLFPHTPLRHGHAHTSISLERSPEPPLLSPWKARRPSARNPPSTLPGTPTQLLFPLVDSHAPLVSLVSFYIPTTPASLVRTIHSDLLHIPPRLLPST